MQTTTITPADGLISARAAPLPAPSPAARPRFYLVGEAERSTRRPAVETGGRTTISVNGRWHALRGRTATFAQVLNLAFPDRQIGNPGAATVTFRHGDPARPVGMLTPGDVIELRDGLHINANATSAS